MADNSRLKNPLAPVTAAVSKIAASNVVQETRNLLFHHIHNTKENKEVFADFVTILRSKPLSKLSQVEKEAHRKKLEDTCRKLLTRLSRVGLKYEVRRGSEDLIFVFILCPLDRLKQESARIRDIDEDTEGPLTDAERLRLVHDIITNPLSEGGADINPGLGEFELIEGFLPLQDRTYNELILPYLIRFGSFSMKRIQNNGATKDGGRNEDESAFLKRVRKEVKLPVYQIYEDYAEMITQANDLVQKEEYELKKRLLEKAGIFSGSSHHEYENDESMKKREDSEWFWHSDHTPNIEEALQEIMQDKTE
ncbi:16552_t:CDS:2 [Racocetra fulgida]|uniref:16552_t:CDS:1 n=1 Tax=Racocetra fulgida TaxID=60492 RepID=A0A9N9BPV2_9GLOM|nr:16552_t:CDS:2 [Racocetra fulgida]